MKVPEKMLYTKDHEWISIEGEYGCVGITDYAQKQLGDIVYVEIKGVGTHVERGGIIATLESVKSVADVFAPVSGEIVEINESLRNEPSLINTDSYGKGWIAKLKIKSPEEVKELMDYKAYIEFTGSSS